MNLSKSINLSTNDTEPRSKYFWHTLLAVFDQQKDASVSIVISKRLLIRIVQALKKLFSVKLTLKVLKCEHVEDIQNMRNLYKNRWYCDKVKFGNATAWYTHVSTILKVLSLAFNTVNTVCLQALMTSL